jgi:hypothetical protein
MRIGFAGTPAFAAAALGAILDAGLAVSVVLTRPDRPHGRGMKLAPGPVKALAAVRGISVQQPPSLKDEAACARITATALDVLVVAAYGLILPGAILAAASTSMRRCCRAGAGPRRFSARCSPATPRRASRSCVWTKGSTPVRSSPVIR